MKDKKDKQIEILLSIRESLHKAIHFLNEKDDYLTDKQCLYEKKNLSSGSKEKINRLQQKRRRLIDVVWGKSAPNVMAEKFSSGYYSWELFYHKKGG